MLSIGIIVPSWHYFADPYKLQPLNELYFATVIESRVRGNGVSVSVIDLRQIRKKQKVINAETINAYVIEKDIYLYWIAKAADYVEIVSVVNQLKHLYPKAKHVAGGTHVENMTKECENVFDAVVIGPGEESFIKIIEDLRNGRINKKYLSDWGSVNYNDYPFPRRNYLPESAIVNTTLFEQYGGLRSTSAMFSRGCNFKCAYCVYNVPNKIQMRSPEMIGREIEYLKTEYHLKAINLRDEICIPILPKTAIPYLEAVGESQITWRGQTRVGVPKEIIAMASESGCIELAIGVESASQGVLDIIRKGQNLQQVRDFIEASHKVGIRIKMCLILGLPGEPADIVEITRRFIDETTPDYVNISGFCPVPGSDIFRNSKYYGIKHIDNDWRKHAHLVYRFSDDEHFGLPFEYEDTNQWGKAFKRSEIIENIKTLQHYLKERKMAY